MWSARASASEPAGLNVPVAGSQTSAEARTSSPMRQPPTTRTRPSGRSVAVWSARASASEPAGPNVPVAGSQTSAEARAMLVADPQPPTTRTRPSGRGVAVW